MLIKRNKSAKSVENIIFEIQDLFTKFEDALKRHCENIGRNYHKKTVNETPYSCEAHVQRHDNTDMNEHYENIDDHIWNVDMILLRKSVGGKDILLRKSNGALANAFHHYQKSFAMNLFTMITKISLIAPEVFMTIALLRSSPSRDRKLWNSPAKHIWTEFPFTLKKWKIFPFQKFWPIWG
jgi:hypothetical protein